jgi:hypothetical protein
MHYSAVGISAVAVTPSNVSGGNIVRTVGLSALAEHPVVYLGALRYVRGLSALAEHPVVYLGAL